MRARQITDLVRISYVYAEGRLRCLLNTYARLRVAGGRGCCGWLNGRRYSWASREGPVVVVIVQIDRVERALQRWNRCRGRRGGGGSSSSNSGAPSSLFLLWRCMLACWPWGRVAQRCTEGTQGVFYGLELRCLRAILLPTRPSCGG